MAHTLTNTAYRAMRAALTSGALFVQRGEHATLGVINAIGNARHGEIRKTQTIRKTGQIVHRIAGVMLTRYGLNTFRDEALRRGDTLPPALLDALAATAPPPPRPPHRSITHDADPFTLLGTQPDPIPF